MSDRGTRILMRVSLNAGRCFDTCHVTSISRCLHGHACVAQQYHSCERIRIQGGLAFDERLRTFNSIQSVCDDTCQQLARLEPIMHLLAQLQHIAHEQIEVVCHSELRAQIGCEGLVHICHVTQA